MKSLSSVCRFFRADLDRLKNHFFFGKGGISSCCSFPMRPLLGDGDAGRTGLAPAFSAEEEVVDKMLSRRSSCRSSRNWEYRFSTTHFCPLLSKTWMRYTAYFWPVLNKKDWLFSADSFFYGLVWIEVSNTYSTNERNGLVTFSSSFGTPLRRIFHEYISAELTKWASLLGLKSVLELLVAGWFWLDRFGGPGVNDRPVLLLSKRNNQYDKPINAFLLDNLFKTW